MTRHANPRFYVGPKTNELIVCIKRSYNTKVDDMLDVRVEFTQRGVCEPTVSTWVPYGFENDEAHFEMNDAFITDPVTFPKGFYDGKIYVDDCHMGDIEMVKAPGHYVSKITELDERCTGDTTWVEPECVIEDPECVCAGATCNGCPTCCNETYVATVDIQDGYVDWESEDILDECGEGEMDPGLL